MDSAKTVVDAVTAGVKKVAIGAGEGKKPKKEKMGADAAAVDAGPLEMNPPPSCELPRSRHGNQPRCCLGLLWETAC